jgi:hypothetical protein
MKKSLIIAVASLCLVSIETMPVKKCEFDCTKLTDKEIKDMIKERDKWTVLENVECYHCRRPQFELRRKDRDTFTMRCKFPDCDKYTAFWIICTNGNCEIKGIPL